MRNNMEAGWFYSAGQIRRYLLTRVTSLKPPRTQVRNPVAILRGLDSHQWLLFTAGLLSWTWDAFDFVTVSLCVTEIAEDFGEEVSAVSWSLTISLMLRSVGALVFGALSDRYGRKWTLITNLFLFAVFELASGFAQSLPQLLGIRALYGIAMGGLYAPAVATALEDLPDEANGVLSGLYQQGSAVGGLLAAVFYSALVPTTHYGWRSLFWFGAAPPLLIIAFRMWLPETNAFQAMRREQDTARLERHGTHVKSAVPTRATAWLSEVWISVKQNWVLFVYMILLMTAFNSTSHGASDMYPTFLKNQVGLSATNMTVIIVVGNIGSIIGGTIGGYVSTFLGRRLTMIICSILGGAVLPAAIIPRSLNLNAGVFFLQFFLGSTWGPIPIYLSELSPPAIRTTVIGLTYQLGNLSASAASTIQAVLAERYPLPSRNGVQRYDYGRVIATFVGIVWASEEERGGNSNSIKQAEELRRQGTNLAEIEAQRVKTTTLKTTDRIRDVSEERAGIVEKV
ncbi:sugar transporter family protein [Biscogniauxia mediterranea]|nr:sugar transporter family protein [Biscogniauxia mediterranea]